MVASTRLEVKPEVLIWARKTARLDLSAAARALRVSENQIRNWENGSQSPTIIQLRSIADRYNRPLAAFFMSAPLPSEPLPTLPDFRKTSMKSDTYTVELQRAVSRAWRQREALNEIAEGFEYSSSAVLPLFYFSKKENPENLGKKLRALLKIEKIRPSIIAKPENYLRELIWQVEQLQVYVIQVQRIDLTVMRGFSFGDGPNPILALNSSDSYRGKTFTLLHELAHIGFRSNGLCDLSQESNDVLERMCDRVAAATLMPKDEFTSLVSERFDGTLTTDIARDIGDEFGASGESAVLRMVELGFVEWSEYWRLKPAFEDAYRKAKTRQREDNEKSDKKIGLSLKVRDYGKKFIRQVIVAYNEEVISSSDLTQFLDTQYEKVNKLAGKVGVDLS